MASLPGDPGQTKQDCDVTVTHKNSTPNRSNKDKGRPDGDGFKEKCEYGQWACPVRPCLEFSSSAWDPGKINDMSMICYY